jgi:hypothetical protein
MAKAVGIGCVFLKARDLEGNRIVLWKTPAQE